MINFYEKEALEENVQNHNFKNAIVEFIQCISTMENAKYIFIVIQKVF